MVRIYLFITIVLLHLLCQVLASPNVRNDYLEVYPDPTDPNVVLGRTPLYFGLIQSLGGPSSLYDGSGSVAGVKVALDRINNDSSVLPGYTLHYTFADSKVCGSTCTGKSIEQNGVYQLNSFLN